MIILLSKSNLIGSKLISRLTRDKGQDLDKVPSHLSILFYERLIIEAAVFLGVRFNYYPYFIKKNRVIAAFKYVGPGRDRPDFIHYRRIANKYFGQGYDYKGALWFAWQALRKWLFNKPIKKVNKWESQRRQFCTEMIEEVLEHDVSSLDPNSMLKYLRRHEYFIEINPESLCEKILQ